MSEGRGRRRRGKEGIGGKRWSMFEIGFILTTKVLYKRRRTLFDSTGDRLRTADGLLGSL